MNDEKWGNVIFMVQDSFGGFEERFSEPVYEQGEAEQQVQRGTKEVIVFTTPMGRIRLERTSRPLILDKKFHYHKGSAGQAQVEYTYSDTEQTHSLEAFKDEGGEWEPIEGGMPFTG